MNPAIYYFTGALCGGLLGYRIGVAHFARAAYIAKLADKARRGAEDDARLARLHQEQLQTLLDEACGRLAAANQQIQDMSKR